MMPNGHQTATVPVVTLHILEGTAVKVATFFGPNKGIFVGTTQPEICPQFLEIPCPCPCKISAEVISIWFVNQSWSFGIIGKFQFNIRNLFRDIQSLFTTTNPIS